MNCHRIVCYILWFLTRCVSGFLINCCNVGTCNSYMRFSCANLLIWAKLLSLVLRVCACVRAHASEQQKWQLWAQLQVPSNQITVSLATVASHSLCGWLAALTTETGVTLDLACWMGRRARNRREWGGGMEEGVGRVCGGWDVDEIEAGCHTSFF